MPSSTRQRSSRDAQRPVTDEHELARPPRRAHAGRRTRASSSSTRLISVIRPSQPITKRLVADAELALAAPRARRQRCGRRASRSRPSRMTAIRSAGAMPRRDELVAHLGADRDQRVRTCARARARPRGTRPSSPGRSTRAARGRGTCGRSTGGPASPASAAATGRPPRPSRCGCAGCAGAARG